MTPTIQSAELSENKDLLRLCLNLPGVAAKDVQVIVDQDIIVVRAIRRSYSIDGTKCLLEYNIYKRYGLDTEIVDTSQMNVDLNLGILTIQVLKKKKSTPIEPATLVPRDDEVVKAEQV